MMRDEEMSLAGGTDSVAMKALEEEDDVSSRPAGAAGFAAREPAGPRCGCDCGCGRCCAGTDGL